MRGNPLKFIYSTADLLYLCGVIERDADTGEYVPLPRSRRRALDQRIRVLCKGETAARTMADGSKRTYSYEAQLVEGRDWMKKGSQYFFSEVGVKKAKELLKP